VLSEIRERVIKEYGVFVGNEMIPLSRNPETISIAYGLRNSRAVAPVRPAPRLTGASGAERWT
jgi:hypothetical protein